MVGGVRVKQKGVTRPDHASLSRAALNSDAAQTPKAHQVVGVRVMMDRKQQIPFMNNPIL
jgi:hypothetical protein